ncbi:MAG: threonine synthase [Spirochaetes bacterium GWF1_41_5]|nr:MAG: threonine synthase [Spirochaetes bacterium GWF1_41_5]HBE02735.1 threonine synthase [Spirochaetia bacterium]
MKPHAFFRCINPVCRKTYALDEIIYQCSKCRSLLEVEHDLEILRAMHSAAGWKQLFDERYRSNSWPWGSGIWGKKEFVLPEIPAESIISMYEGNTNLFWAKRLGEEINLPDLWVKQCGVTHTGSFKDLGMTVLVSQVNHMINNKKNIVAVACASTGDTSAALSAYAAYAGIPSIVFLPRNKISTAQLIQPIANGALVLSLDTDFDGCMKIVTEITKDNSIYLANSMNSLRIEGQKTISLEITQQFNWEVPDYIIIPGGNLGNISALGKGFKIMKELGMIDRLPVIIAAQAEKANPLYLSYKNNFSSFTPVIAGETAASAIRIGSPVSWEKAVAVLKETGGMVEQATEEELSDAAARGDRTGMFNCPHTGVALAVLFKLREKNIIKAENRVVIISTAHGLKFSEFKVKYHEGALSGSSSGLKNPPVELPADTEKVRSALYTLLKKNGNLR